ncbi:hypothetical protein GI584_13105 [Gracilibacillus salitolerans]|uniref:Competence protein ComG n=1 Tax=Gracilibacillus salitolerans TaxID=2663022 RepID=A0A5Q2TM32_9BACI|nr:hypothetical protein [Gracilibacillus salitolerans]QGH34920.1 hypothetical protein GI584_13105 [Gracilibacillus salitolerans]
MKKYYLKKFKNEKGYIFPLTSFIILLLLLFTYHQILQIQNLKRIHQLNDEQYKLELLYQKAYGSILKEEKAPPYSYTFPDGTINITASPNQQDRSIYKIKMSTDTGGYREVHVEIPD